jgi:hypothetical protein
LAQFDPPNAIAKLKRWREENAELLVQIGPENLRIDTGRAGDGHDFARVWVIEPEQPEATP